MKVGYAIELLFDREFDDYVRTLWQSCSDNNLSKYMKNIKGDVIPHIALSVYEDVDEETITSLFTRYKNVKEHKAYFESGAICMFKATNVTYLNVNVNRDMLNFFENVYHFFVSISAKCSPYYLPYVIIPHISIAKCDEFEDAKKCWCHVADIFEPQRLLVEKVALFKLYFDDEHRLVDVKLMDEKVLLD